MQCRQFKTRVGWFLETPGGGRWYEAMRQHARECPACGRELKAEQDLQRCLETLPQPEMRPGFRERVLSRAIAQEGLRHARRRRKWTRIAISGFATACAAAFLTVWLWPAVWLWPVSPGSGAAISQVALTLHKTRQVGFVFHVHHQLHDARIVVNLPKGVEIDGHRARRLSWRVNLNRGDNLLKLPLIARAPGDGVVSAEVVAVGSVLPLARAQLKTHVAGSSRAVAPAGTSGV